MDLRITVIPASTQAGRETIRALLADERQPFVHAIYRDPSKAPAEFVKHAQFKAVRGDVSATSGLDFSDSDAVFYIPPPTYDGTDSAEFATRNAVNIKSVLERAPSVKRLVILSAVGAQYEHGNGILVINHVTDKILARSVPEVVITRGVYFHEIWAEAFETMNADPSVFYSSMTPPDHKIAMIGLQDVGEKCANALLGTGTALPSQPTILELHGPRNYSTLDVQSALEHVTGKRPEVISIEPDQLVSFYGQKVTEQYAKELAEMTIATLSGGIIAADMEKDEGIVRGKVELVESLRKIWTGQTTKVASGVF